MWYLYTDGSYSQVSKNSAGAFLLLKNEAIIEKNSISVSDKNWGPSEAELFAISLGIFACIRHKINEVILITDFFPAYVAFLKKATTKEHHNPVKRKSNRQAIWCEQLVKIIEDNNLTIIPMLKSNIEKYHNMCDKASKSARLTRFTHNMEDFSEYRKSVHIGWTCIDGVSAAAALVLAGSYVIHCNTIVLENEKNTEKVKNHAIELGKQLAEEVNCKLVLGRSIWRNQARKIAKNKIYAEAM